jgi:hypothetical protein
VTAHPYRWRLEEFVAAWDAGAFDSRVELVDGEVWAVPIGNWHGDTAARLLRALPNARFQVSTSSLPTSGSLPDPDCWVRAASTAPAGLVSQRLARWSAEDVLLVIEVADETIDHDLGAKAALYARAGYPCYWAVTRGGIYEHTGPRDIGYQRRVLYLLDQEIPVQHAGVALAVADLLASG